jgi:hypothetical protein
MPDGSPMWRASATGHERAIAELQLWAAKTRNEVRVMHIETNALIAAVNLKKPDKTP